MNHYTYKITNLLNGRSYIGVRSTYLSPSNDLGILYYSSSSDIDFINEQKDYPSKFIYEIIEVFSNRKDALKHEIELHNLYDVANNEMFYNRSKQTSHAIDFTGCHHNEESKKRIGVASTARGISDKAKENLKWHRENRIRTEEERLKMSIAKLNNTNAAGERDDDFKRSRSLKMKSNNFMKGKKHSDQSKQKMSLAKLGDNNPKYWSGKTMDDETKAKISESRKGKNMGPCKTVECPHCGKNGGINTMNRWHFDNCKNKKVINGHI